MRDHGSLWRHSAVRGLRGKVTCNIVSFAQCMLEDGAEVQKYTSLLHSSDLGEHLSEIRQAHTCAHDRHKSVAHGRDAHGRGLAELAAAYPLGLSRAIARAVAALATRRRLALAARSDDRAWPQRGRSMGLE